MASPATDFDYEEIVKKLIKQDVATEELEDKKNLLASKRWHALRGYYESKSKFGLTETTHNVAKNFISSKAKMRSVTEREHAFFDEKFNYLQELYTEMETKGRNQREQFFENMEELYHEFRKLSLQFDDENIHQQIKNYTQATSSFQEEIVNTNKEMERLKNFMKNINSSDDLPDIKKIAELIQKGSLEKYGDSVILQYRLSEMYKSVEVLSKKIQDVKVKYDI